MISPSLGAFVDFLNTYNRFAIVGHKDPDGDCLASQLAMEGLLSRRGKEAKIYSPGPFTRPEIRHLQSKFLETIPKGSADAVVVVDCSTLDRVGDLADSLENLPKAILDHHASGKPFGDIRYIDINAPSVTFLVLELFKALDIEPTQEEAEWLLFGLCTDTGYFRHLGESSKDAFASASYLVGLGASPKRVYQTMFGGRPLDSRRLLGRFLSRTESYFDGRVLYSFEDLADLEEFGPDLRDSDGLYSLLQSVLDCEAIVFVRQENESLCSVGLRSSRDLDVGKIAKELGGGGHKNASGYDRPGRIEGVKKEVLERFARELDSSK